MKRFTFMLEQFSRQKKQEFDEELQKKRYCEGTSTNKLESNQILSPNDRDGEIEYFHQRQASFSRGQQKEQQNKRAPFSSSQKKDKKKTEKLLCRFYNLYKQPKQMLKR